MVLAIGRPFPERAIRRELRRRVGARGGTTGKHRGIAIGQSVGSYVADVAEITVARDGTVRIDRLVAVVDGGHATNPDTVRQQVETAMAFGLSAAPYGNITIKDGRAEQPKVSGYPALTIAQSPRVDRRCARHREPIDPKASARA